MGTVSVFDARAAIQKTVDQLVTTAAVGQTALGAIVLPLQDRFFAPEVESRLASTWPSMQLIKTEIPYLILTDKNPHRKVLSTLSVALNGSAVARTTSSVIARDLLLSFARQKYFFLIDFADRIDSQSLDFLTNSEYHSPFILLGRSDRLWAKLADLNGSVIRFAY